MTVLTLTGVPGSGKTTLALEVARLLGIEQLVQTDTLKEILLLHQAPPIATGSSYQAWKFLGEKTKGNIYEGFRQHTSYFEDSLLRLISWSVERQQDILVEGVQMTPWLFAQIPTEDKHGFYLQAPSLEEHLSRLSLKNSRRVQHKRAWDEHYSTLQVLDEWLAEESRRYGVTVLTNDSVEGTVQRILQRMHQREGGLCLVTATT